MLVAKRSPGTSAASRAQRGDRGWGELRSYPQEPADAERSWHRNLFVSLPEERACFTTGSSLFGRIAILPQMAQIAAKARSFPRD